MKRTNLAHLNRRVVVVVSVVALSILALFIGFFSLRYVEKKNIENKYIEQQKENARINFLKGLAVRPDRQGLVDSLGLKGAMMENGEDVLLHPTDAEISKYLETHALPGVDHEYGIIVENFFYDKEGNVIYSPETRSYTLDAIGPYPDRGNGALTT